MLHPHTEDGEVVRAIVCTKTYQFSITHTCDGKHKGAWSSKINSELHQKWVDIIRKTWDVKQARITRDKLMSYLCASVQAKDYIKHEQVQPKQTS